MVTPTAQRDPPPGATQPVQVTCGRFVVEQKPCPSGRCAYFRQGAPVPLTRTKNSARYKLASTQTAGEPRRLTRPALAQTACEGEARISQVDLITLFRKVDDSRNEKIELDELVDLFDGQNNNALVLPDCDDADFPDYWLGDGTCDDGSDGRANLNCKLYACDNGDCGGTC